MSRGRTVRVAIIQGTEPRSVLGAALTAAGLWPAHRHAGGIIPGSPACEAERKTLAMQSPGSARLWPSAARVRSVVPVRRSSAPAAP
jgi:hypothetical protein